MNDECLRIADQLHRAFNGEAWHGPSLQELLRQVKAQEAATHPGGNAHSIWEIVLHIRTWANAALQANRGIPVPASVNDLPLEQDWPPVKEQTAAAWDGAIQQIFAIAQELETVIKTFDEARLRNTVPGRDYNFYFLFHGVVQHSLYHAGQIALLKKMTVGG